jgi:hypothetical protein
MNPNEILKRHFLTTVEEHLASGEPPQTAETYQRLQSEGYNDGDARLLIAQCVALEYVQSIQTDLPFDYERFAKNLSNLPAQPMM